MDVRIVEKLEWALVTVIGVRWSLDMPGLTLLLDMDMTGLTDAGIFRLCWMKCSRSASTDGHTTLRNRRPDRDTANGNASERH